jgi:hypothetical protein
MGRKVNARQATESGKRCKCGWACRAAIALVVLVLASLGAAYWAVHHAEPLLRARVVNTLEARFHSRVELTGLHVSVFRGLEVEGNGLKIFPLGRPQTVPLIAADRFSFHTGWSDLFRAPMLVREVRISNLSLNLPPKGQRRALPPLTGRLRQQAMAIVVERLDVDRAELTLETSKPGKSPLIFSIARLRLDRIGPDEPMRFTATLTNPKPIGEIQTAGRFGPFNGASPGETPVTGHYHFAHADLSTIAGIGGVLSSTGEFSGRLNHIVVDGQTRTPDFQIAGVNHPMPLNTRFHAIVDGTTGNTYLQPVNATLHGSQIVARGEVVRGRNGYGHEIQLKVTVDKARIQDFLAVAVKAEPPLMNGAVKMHVLFYLPPGKAAVMDRLHLKGDFDIVNAKFSSRKIQTDVDQLSLRAQGKPEKAKELHKAQEDGKTTDSPRVTSQIRGYFVLANAQLLLRRLEYRLPGAIIGLAGTYSLDHKTLDLHGEVRTQAMASQMTTGWKSLVLKVADPFLKKPGVGMQLPIKIKGSQTKPEISLDFKHRHRDHRVLQSQHSP